MSFRTLLMMILVAGTVLSNVACQKKHPRKGDGSNGTSAQKPQPSGQDQDPQGCPAHLAGDWKIGTTSQTLSFDTSNGQTKIAVPMGDYSLVDGVSHTLAGGTYIGQCSDGKLVFILTQIAGNGVVISETKWVITTADQNNGQAELSLAQRNPDTNQLDAPRTETYGLSRR